MKTRFNATKKTIITILFHFLVLSCEKDDSVTPEYLLDGTYEGNYFPTQAWRTCNPESVGINSKELEKVHNYIANDSINTNGLLIIKDRYIIYEEYFNEHHESSLHHSYSIAKSFSSAGIGLAIENRYIESVNDSIKEYFPQLQSDNIQIEKKEITIKHLLTMSAGFEWNENDYYYDNSTNDIFVMMNESNDFIDYVLSKPVINKPGEIAYYSSGESMLLSGIVENACGQNMYSFMDEYLFRKIGINNLRWDQDPSGHTIGGWGVNTTLRNFARFGLLYLNHGMWDGIQILPEGWVNESVNPINSGINNYGYQWWIGKGMRSFTDYNIPNDTFLGVGIYRQYLIIIPSENIIIVRTGYDIPNETANWKLAELITLIIDAKI